MAAIKPRISVEYAENTAIVTFTDKSILEEKDIQALGKSIMSVIEQADLPRPVPKGRGERSAGTAEGMKLILDFCNVRFLSSAVLGLLIRISKKAYEHGGQLRLCNINPKIYEIFRITRLTKIFDIYQDVKSATEGLSKVD